MSTAVYAELTNQRASGTGIRTYMDTFAALVPSEVLALHSLIISVTTKSAQHQFEDQMVNITIIPPEAVQALSLAFWGLFVLSWVLYVVPRIAGGHWDIYDWIRAAIAPFAFVGWTMLQRTTAFDAAFPELPNVERTVIALFIAVILGATSTILAQRANQQTTISQHIDQ